MKGKLYNQEPTCTEELRLHQIREINPFISKRPGLQSPGLKQEQLNSELPWADSCAVCKCGHPLWRSGQGVTQVRMEPSMQEMIWTMKRDIKGGQHPPSLLQLRISQCKANSEHCCQGPLQIHPTTLLL